MIKRFMEIIGSIVGLLVLSPLFCIISILITIDSSGPVFYLSRRIGEKGSTFVLCKFRSMVNDADKWGPGITASEDNRMTRVGKFLRNTKLDELPQLINVLKGEMSFIGPRPEIPRYVALYSCEQLEILQSKPGITSAASLIFRHEQEMLNDPDWETIYITKIMPAKITIDLEYLRNRTPFTDFGLIVRTILAICRGHRGMESPVKNGIACGR